jgi:poly(A) polymerase
MAAGAPEGPLVGEAMRQVEDWWVDNDFPADRRALMDRLKAVVEGMVR